MQHSSPHARALASPRLAKPRQGMLCRHGMAWFGMVCLRLIICGVILEAVCEWLQCCGGRGLLKYMSFSFGRMTPAFFWLSRCLGVQPTSCERVLGPPQDCSFFVGATVPFPLLLHCDGSEDTGFPATRAGAALSKRRRVRPPCCFPCFRRSLGRHL